MNNNIVNDMGAPSPNFDLKRRNKELIEESIAKKQTRLESVPRIVQIENTSRCAFECIACPHFYQKSRVGVDVFPQVVERLNEILPGAEQLHIVGGGEPFGDRGLIDSIESYARHGVRISTITSLMQLSSRMLDLIKSNFRSIRISVDGATAETYEGIRKGHSFPRLLKNIKKVRATGNDLEMIMGVNLCRQNLRELPALIRLGKNLGFDRIVVSKMIPRPLDMPHTVRDDIMIYPAATSLFIREARKLAEELQINVELPKESFDTSQISLRDDLKEVDRGPRFPSPEYQDQLASEWWATFKSKSDILSRPRPLGLIPIDPPDQPIPSTGVCERLYEQTFINANGDVGTCSLMPTRSLGNLLDHSSFFDIWNGESMVALRESYWKGIVPHHCYGCPALMGGFLNRVKLDRSVSKVEFATNRFD